MRFERLGSSPDEIMRELDRYFQRDSHFRDGRIMGSMCTDPDLIARESYMKFMETNLGNPGLYPGTAQLERDVIGMLLDILKLDPHDTRNTNAGGQMVSGGTEANITALWLARNLTGKKEIVLPESGHFSLFKAANLLGMRTRIVPLDDRFRMDLDIMGEMVSDDTAVIVGIAGTTELGQVDPIKEIGAVADDLSIPFHVDAAFGGFVLPFLKDFTLPFDFRCPGVTSMGVDPHKMGLATVPSGILLLRDRDVQKTIGVSSPYLTTERNMSLSGTRNSASIAATYAVMRSMGHEGYERVVERCMEHTRYLAKRIRDLGLTPAMEPVMNVLAARMEDPQVVVKRMQERGWHLSKASHPPSVRFVIMPHVSREHIDLMVEDLEDVLS